MSAVGRGDRFRSGSWIERGVDRLRRGRAAAAPPLLKRAFEAVLDRMPGGQLESVLPEGERVRLRARYRHMTWNLDEYRALRAVVRRGGTVLDIGANVGAYTLMFAIWVGDTGTVVAFEPAPNPREGLREHVALNGFEDRVEISDVAIGATSGAAAFALHAAGGASSLAIATVDAAVQPVPEVDDGLVVQAERPARDFHLQVQFAEQEVVRGDVANQRDEHGPAVLFGRERNSQRRFPLAPQLAEHVDLPRQVEAVADVLREVLGLRVVGGSAA